METVKSYESAPKLTSLEEFRVNTDKIKQVDKCVLHARDEEGFLKYENKSHFYRCAVMRLLREELSKIEVKRGRPRKNAKKQ